MYNRVHGGWELRLPFPAPPASRPRVGRWGTYYSKTYEEFRKEAKRFFEDIHALEGNHAADMVCLVVVVCARPKTTKRRHPKGDWDNFAKGPCDVVPSGLLWEDDDQIVFGGCYKRYAEKHEEPHVLMRVLELPPGLPAKNAFMDLMFGSRWSRGEDVYDLHPDARVSWEELKERELAAE